MGWFDWLRPKTFRIPAADPPRRTIILPPGVLDQRLQRLPRTTAERFHKLAHAYNQTSIEFPHLKDMTFAQWAYESAWGGSSLARRAWNFAGMKWSPKDGKFGGKPEGHTTGDGYESGFRYTEFPTFDSFIRAYWGRLDNVSAYRGWREHTATPYDFLKYVGPIWVGYNPKAYIHNVSTIYEKYMRGLFEP